MNKQLIKMIVDGRQNAGLTQSEVGSRLGIKGNTVSDWERGRTEPDIDTFIQLCKIYSMNVTGVLNAVYNLSDTDDFLLTKSEMTCIKQYRALDNHGKDMVDTVLSKEHDRCATSIYQVREETAKYGTIKLPLPDNRASAGAGDEFLSDASRQIYVLANRLTIRADFVVSVDGHSMEPLYYDGDLVLIHQQPAVDIGAIGLYAVEDKGYIKKQGPDRLISINPEYPDIVPEEYQECRCFGEVIGKVEPEWIVEG